MPRYILVHSTASTNSYLSKMAMMLPGGTVIHTPEQTAGRGQKGNTWESETGKNVIFSMLLKKPMVPVANQFYISEAVSVAIVEVLSQYIGEFSIKWPNDIYHDDRKVCGILIEHSIMGSSINHSILGVGINVNQVEFKSDAPNPVSLAQLLDRDVDVDDVLHRVCEAMEKRCAFDAYTESAFEELHKEYLSLLYRKDDKYHRFVLPEGDEFDAKIVEVETTGMLVLERENGMQERFAFKEVGFVI